ncbi:hypothetical protein OHC33_010855 [Knufia fluminis]|uniref:Uncharacterized protein n=1 Tax=Knufia fluminis TaxID=191047 RepID=A0AAN8I156_9EURO|nr:hypothetical protein OHC33_010855 [Knufia fluminis]
MATINDLPQELLQKILIEHIKTGTQISDDFRGMRECYAAMRVSKTWCNTMLDIMGTKNGEYRWRELLWGICLRLVTFVRHVRMEKRVGQWEGEVLPEGSANVDARGLREL